MNLHRNNDRSTPSLLEGKYQVSLKDMIIKSVTHWPFFVVGLFIAIVGALLYIYITPPVYEVNATLVINDKNNSSDSKSALEELDVSSSPTTVENELGVLRSRQLISGVVEDLQLWTEYHQENGIKSNDLYEISPVKFHLIKASGALNDNRVKIQIKNENSFYLKDDGNTFKEINFGEEVKSSFGTWKLEFEPSGEIDPEANIVVVLNEPDQVTERLSKSLEVFLESKLGSFVHLSIKDRVPQRGKEILNHLINAYNQRSLSEKNNLTQSTLDFIDNRLVSISEELMRSEMEIQSFRSSQSLTNLSSQSQVYLENAQVNDSKLNEVGVQLSIIEGIEEAINSATTSNLIPATIGISDPALSGLVEKYSQLKLEKEKLLASTPEKNPVFLPVNKQINATEKALREQFRNIKSSLLSTQKELNNYNSKIDLSIKNLPGQERQFLAFSREKAIKEDLYVYLLQKREEVALSYASTLSNARLIDRAYVGPVTHPKKIFVLALAILMGLGIPAAIIFLKHSLNGVILKKEEIENVTGLPVIAELNLHQSPSRLVFKDNIPTALGEQLRTLRTKLHLIHGNKEKGRITLVTSSVASEGKSFLTSNLGLALAASGRKTIILDLDLRKPKIAKYLDLSGNPPGLDYFLSGAATREDTICVSDLSPNLHVISPGGPINSPTEMLETERLVQLIADLKQSYDDVIIDSPPMHLVADALIISQFCDVTLYLVRQGFTNLSELDFIKGLNQENTFNKLHIVFNGVDRKKYGYGYAYDTSYLR